MRSKTKKLIWLAPVAAMFAALGALAIFMTLTPNAAQAQATTTPMDYQAGSPLELTVAPDSTAKRSALVLNWKAPTKGSTDPIIGYRIDQSADGQRWTMLMEVGSDTMTHTHTGLAPATQKYYRVLAMNRAGVGRVSEAKSASTADIGSPSEVQNFTVTAAGPSSIKLDWDPPADDGGARIIGYQIHFGATTTAIPARTTSDVAGSSDGIVSLLTPTTEWTHKSLNGNTTRHYKVYAVNWYDAKMTSKKTSDPVDIRSATTDPIGKPAAPTGLTAVPLVVYCGDGTTREGKVMLDDDSDCDGTPATTPTEAYEPAPNIALYWYWPTDNGGDALDRFRIEVSKTGAWPDGSDQTTGDSTASITTLGTSDYAIMSVSATAASGNTNSYQFNHEGVGPILKSNGTLYYRVFAENGGDTQIERRSLPDSDAAQATVTLSMTQPTKPAPDLVTNVAWSNADAARASTHHHDSVNLSWTEPAPDKTPTSYRVDVAKADDDDPVHWEKLELDTRHSDPTYDHRGWRPEGTAQTYRYRIFAKDGGLIGEASAISAHAVDAQTAPSPVRSLVSKTDSASQNTITWEAPDNDGGTDITRYCVLSATSTSAAIASTGCTAATAPPNVTRKFIEAPKVGVLTEMAPATTYMHKSLLASTTYRYQVFAINTATAEGSALTQPVSPSSEEDPTKTLGTTNPGRADGPIGGIGGGLQLHHHRRAGRAGHLERSGRPGRRQGQRLRSAAQG